MYRAQDLQEVIALAKEMVTTFKKVPAPTITASVAAAALVLWYIF